MIIETITYMKICIKHCQIFIPICLEKLEKLVHVILSYVTVKVRFYVCCRFPLLVRLLNVSIRGMNIWKRTFWYWVDPTLPPPQQNWLMFTFFLLSCSIYSGPQEFQPQSQNFFDKNSFFFFCNFLFSISFSYIIFVCYNFTSK